MALCWLLNTELPVTWNCPLPTEVTAGATTLPRAPVNVWRFPAVAVVDAGTVTAVLLLVEAELALEEVAADLKVVHTCH